MSELIKLLPCPFCGGTPQEDQIGRNGWQIKCASCVILYKQKTLRYDIVWLRERMAEKWNTRTPINTQP